MSSILTSQIEMNDSNAKTSSALVSFAKEAASVLTIFAFAAVPVVLLSLTWV